MRQAKLFGANFNLAYSVLLLLIIPLILVINSLLSFQQRNRDIETQLQQKAQLLADATAGPALDQLDRPEQLQITLDGLAHRQPQITELTVYKLAGEYLIPVASSDPKRLKQRLTDLDRIPAWWQQKRTYSVEVTQANGQGERIGTVMLPLLDSQNNLSSLLISKLSYSEADRTGQAVFDRSFIILFFSIVIIVFLLINHVQLIESGMQLIQLKEVDKMKDDFIAVAAHELRTPLTAIKGYASMLQEGFGGILNEKGLHYLDNVMLSATNLDNLVVDMLDVSRLQQGRMAFSPVTFDPFPSLAKIVDQLSVTAQTKNINLTLTHEVMASSLIVDPDRFRQIFTNLIGNAIKYSEQGTVTVQCIIESGLCRISVQDTGIGMSEEAMSKLFGKFYRIKTERTERITGTGLGLWISKQMVEKMAGTIKVTSQEGVGTCFTVNFPSKPPLKP